MERAWLPALSTRLRYLQKGLTMKRLLSLFFFCLVGCTAPGQGPEKTVSDFYQYYLTAFDEPGKVAYTSDEMRRYVSKETLERLAFIEKIEEQEINESDYFFYGQDYDSNWISALKVKPSQPLLGGVVVPVTIGTENGGQLQLSVFMRREEGRWKIYRVRDETHQYEQPIFDAGRLSGAITHATALLP